MEIKILSENDNRLLKRKEFEALIFHSSEPTPTRATVKDRVAALTNVEPSRTIVYKIDTEYGIGRSKLSFRVYDTSEMMEKVELPYMVKRNNPKLDEKTDKKS